MELFTRICFNENNWQRPSFSETKESNDASFVSLHRFGHEEWLFRTEWLIDGWHYGFLQGLNNKSIKNIPDKTQPIDINLFTIHPDKNRTRCIVGKIRNLECISRDSAQKVFDVYEKNGWLELMLDEIRDQGDPNYFGDPDKVLEVFNLRYRLEDLELAPFQTPIDKGCPFINKYRHYDIYNVSDDEVSFSKAKTHSGKMPNTDSHTRTTKCETKQITPEHAFIQTVLINKLYNEYPNGQVKPEENYIDVLVETSEERILFEVKSDLNPRRVIRDALTQLLEYAFYTPNPKQLKTKLVIVGRCKLETNDERYIRYLVHQYNIPISYRQEKID